MLGREMSGSSDATMREMEYPLCADDVTDGADADRSTATEPAQTANAKTGAVVTRCTFRNTGTVLPSNCYLFMHANNQADRFDTDQAERLT